RPAGIAVCLAERRRLRGGMNNKFVSEYGVFPAVGKFDAELLRGLAPGTPLAEARGRAVAIPVVEEDHATVGDVLAGEQVVEHLDRRAVEIAVQVQHREFRGRR